MMRRIRFLRAGGPEVIAVETAPIPAPGAGELLVRVAYAGVNRPDCLQREGRYPPPPGATEIPGLEISGEVVALGPGVTGFAPGDALCALLAGGGYAEYALVPAPLALPIPSRLTLAEAAALPEGAFTVYDNLITRGRLASGETLLIHGAGSGIGALAIEVAKAHGARVIATARGGAKRAFCLELGADRFIDTLGEDFAAVTRAETDGRGADVILDMVGAAFTARNLASLAIEGRLVQIAFLTGSRAEIDLLPLMVKRQTITGSTLRPRSIAEKRVIAERLQADFWPCIERGAIRPRIDSIVPLKEAEAAHRRMESNAHQGKILLDAR